MARGNRFGGIRNRNALGLLTGITLGGAGLLCAFLYGQSTKPDESARPKEVALQVIVVNTPELRIGATHLCSEICSIIPFDKNQGLPRISSAGLASVELTAAGKLENLISISILSYSKYNY